MAQYQNGSVYVGDFWQDQRCGWGTQYFSTDERYEGEWREDKMTGGCAQGGTTENQRLDLLGIEGRQWVTRHSRQQAEKAARGAAGFAINHLTLVTAAPSLLAYRPWLGALHNRLELMRCREGAMDQP